MRSQKPRPRSLVLRALPIAIALGAMLLTPALAGSRKHRNHPHRKHHPVRVHHPHRSHGPAHVRHPHRSHRSAHVRHGHPAHGSVRLQQPFAIPRFVGHPHAGSYGAYYRGRVHYRPHRHDHVVYHFPARTRAGHRVWRPYHYCDGELYTAHVAYRGPKISLSLDF
jgi:hypothetical protein